VAEKLVAILDAAKERLSRQEHYDFGLRKVKTTVCAAGNRKRTNPSESDIDCLFTAMHQLVRP